MKKEFVIRVYTLQHEPPSFAHFGTLRGALRVAKKFARDAFPAWVRGYGPRIMISEAEDLYGPNTVTYQL